MVEKKQKKIPTIKEIRKQSPFKSKYDPFMYIPDYIAVYLVKLLIYTPITPNQVSLFAYLLYVLAAVFIGINRYVILALILLQVVIVLDCADGALARSKKQTSFQGVYYEYTFHETGPPLIFFAVGSYLYLTLRNPIYLYLGGFTALARVIINSFGTAKQRIMYRHLIKTRKVPPNLVGDPRLLKQKGFFSTILYGVLNALPNFAFSSYVITFGYFFGFLKQILVFYFIYFSLIALVKTVIELIIGFKPYGLR